MTGYDANRRFTVVVDGENWEEAESLSEAEAGDHVFVIDNATGRVVFGDGTHGQEPPDNALVTISYRDGEGSSGNTVVSITTRWPPAERTYLVAASSSGIGVGAMNAGVERFGGAKRLRYFAGQLLAASDFEDEQRYLLGRRYLHNRLLHGFGVASGLSVTETVGGSSPSVVIAPGLALDRKGRELELADPVTLPIDRSGRSQYVIAEYVERDADPIPSSGDDAGIVASRIEEGISIRLSGEAVADCGVVLGRIARDSTGWKVDQAFEPARCHSGPM